MALTFEKATRKKVKLKVLIDGPSGSGKTVGALNLARGIVGQTGKIAVIDSEKDRSEYYADRFEFDKLSLTDMRCTAYGQAIHAAIEAGYDAVVIDSLSHAWLNVLDRKEAYDRANPNTSGWANWRMFSEEWEKLIRYILDCPIHVICTARSKQAHEQTTDQNGKKKVVKLGMAPQIREGSEYEFAVVFSLNETHNAEATKDNTFLFGDKTEPINLLDGSVAKKLNEWLSGAAAAPKPIPVSPPAPTAPDNKPTTPTKPPANNPPANGNHKTPQQPADPFTLEKMIAAFSGAKIESGEAFGEWMARIVAKLPTVAVVKDGFHLDLTEAMRDGAGVGEQVPDADIWKNWTPEMVTGGKIAALAWLRGTTAK